MVYCGKPSRGCQMCRTRRIKCDETKPTCNQCAKSRRQCPGYKDEFDLVFRNETKATERRAQKASRKAMAQKMGGKQPMALDTKAPAKQVLVPSPGVSIETQANCYFISNFILVPRGRRTHGFLDFVLPLLKQEGAQAHLRHAFDACSMAFLNNRGGSGGRLTEKALSAYTLALTGTNNALRDLEEQRKDSTLAAVLLLGLFESITAKQIGSMNWGSHTWGAIQLVKARGRKQLKTPVGLQLFIAVRTQMIIHSLTTGTAPTMGSEWWINDAVSDPTAAASLRILIKTAELRAEVTRLMNGMARTPDSIEVMLDMIRKAQAVDRDAVAWMAGVPAAWRFRTVAWEDHVPPGEDYARAEVFPGRVDVYRDFWTASVWNLSRTARLILASLVVRCAAWVCAPVDYRTTPEYATAARTCADVIADIIASVPYHLGWHLRRKHLLRAAAGRNGGGGGSGGQGEGKGQGLDGGMGNDDYDFDLDDDDESNEENGTKGLAGYFLTWPMTCVSSNDFTTDAQRAWIHGRLRFIGNELGVKYAHILRQLPIRIPSMMIRRDGLMASPWGANHNLEKYVSAKLDPPAAAAVVAPGSDSSSNCSSKSTTPTATTNPTPTSACFSTSSSSSFSAYSASISTSISTPGTTISTRDDVDDNQATTTKMQAQKQKQKQMETKMELEMEMLRKAAALQKQQAAQEAAATYLGQQHRHRQQQQQQQQQGYDSGIGVGVGVGVGSNNTTAELLARMTATTTTATTMGVGAGAGGANGESGYAYGYGYGYGYGYDGYGVENGNGDAGLGVGVGVGVSSGGNVVVNGGVGGVGTTTSSSTIQPQWMLTKGGYPPI
ncbi:hypothetical protein F5X96DRAFT_273799 [Biscogniauxia mediterranea]|nr:hypothetical protein F5X96DRAFT_273799 [Biscogniauxia mediterranea]